MNLPGPSAARIVSRPAMAPKVAKVEPFDLVVFSGVWSSAASIALVERDGGVWNEEFE